MISRLATISLMPASPHIAAMDRVIDRLGRLPGIGKRSAERIAFYLLKSDPQEAALLAQAVADLKRNVRHCSACFNLAECDPCPICADVRRDQSMILVVEQPADVATMETTGLYRGVYHVLMGRLAPLDGVGPGELNVEALLNRVTTGDVREVILGLNPTLEGDGTTLYLAQRLEQLGVKVSRLARGLPSGSSLERVSKAVLADALEGRRSV